MANVPSTSLTDLLQRRMEYDTQRTEVLSQNIANSDTPGYKEKDLAPMSFDSTLKQVGMKVDDPRHIVPPSLAGVAPTVKASSIETLPDGNSVDLEQQMMEVSKTAVDYQGITSIYRSIGNMIKIALKGSTS